MNSSGDIAKGVALSRQRVHMRPSNPTTSVGHKEERRYAARLEG